MFPLLANDFSADFNGYHLTPQLPLRTSSCLGVNVLQGGRRKGENGGADAASVCIYMPAIRNEFFFNNEPRKGASLPECISGPDLIRLMQRYRLVYSSFSNTKLESLFGDQNFSTSYTPFIYVVDLNYWVRNERVKLSAHIGYGTPTLSYAIDPIVLPKYRVGRLACRFIDERSWRVNLWAGRLIGGLLEVGSTARARAILCILSA